MYWWEKEMKRLVRVTFSIGHIIWWSDEARIPLLWQNGYIWSVLWRNGVTNLIRSRLWPNGRVTNLTVANVHCDEKHRVKRAWRKKLWPSDRIPVIYVLLIDSAHYEVIVVPFICNLLQKNTLWAAIWAFFYSSASPTYSGRGTNWPFVRFLLI